MLGCSPGCIHGANEVPSGRGEAPLLSSVAAAIVMPLQALREDCSLRRCRSLSTSTAPLLNLNNPHEPL